MAQGYWQSIKTSGAGLHWVVAQAIGGDSDTGSQETAAAEAVAGRCRASLGGERV